MDIVAKQVRIVGRVPGMCYRSWTVQTAQALVQGSEADIARFLEPAWIGPPAARVEDVAAEMIEVSDLRGFEQRSTL